MLGLWDALCASIDRLKYVRQMEPPAPAGGPTRFCWVSLLSSSFLPTTVDQD